MMLVKSTGAVMAVISLNVVITLFAATMIEAQSQLGSPFSKLSEEKSLRWWENSIWRRILTVKTFSRWLTNPMSSPLQRAKRSR